jgi:hypothetical protein
MVAVSLYKWRDDDFTSSAFVVGFLVLGSLLLTLMDIWLLIAHSVEVAVVGLACVVAVLATVAVAVWWTSTFSQFTSAAISYGPLIPPPQLGRGRSLQHKVSLHRPRLACLAACQAACDDLYMYPFCRSIDIFS